MIMKMFIDQFTPDADFEQLSNIAMIINDLILKSTDFSMTLLANPAIRKILLSSLVSDVLASHRPFSSSIPVGFTTPAAERIFTRLANPCMENPSSRGTPMLQPSCFTMLR
jgi:hypothetical protein